MKTSHIHHYKYSLIKLLLYFGISVFTYPCFAQTQTQNYVRTRIPQKAISNNVKLDQLTANKDSVQVEVQYLDGFGRLIQDIHVMGSPLGKDFIQPSAYDPFGRENINYLPYVATTTDGSYKADALTVGGGQAQFYAGPPLGVSSFANPISVNNFEPSPANRIVEQGAPGTTWQPIVNSLAGHTVKTTYNTNNTLPLTDTSNSTLVAFYKATSNVNQSRTLIRNGNYVAGELNIVVKKDENWKSGRGGTEEQYTNHEGQVVLKRQFNYKNGLLQTFSTYFVYDEQGNLCYVLPPGINPDASGVPPYTNSLGFIYRYDERNRLTQKKIPGKGWEFSVYNYLDQRVLNQDSTQRLTSQWTVTKYDGLGRVIMTGLWNAGASIPLSTLQSNIYGVTQYDSRDQTNNTTSYPYGYILGSYPIMSKILTVNYYDDYNFPNLPSGYKVTNGVNLMPKGLLTASQTAVLNTINNGTPDMLWDVYYYDDRGRINRSYKQHYLGGTFNVANFDVVINTYSFTDLVTTTNRRHFTKAANGVPQVTINNQYIYDHVGRKVKTWQQFFNNAPMGDNRTLLSKIDYNEIGQIWKKNLHSVDSVNFKQTLTYSYNERGWLAASSSDLFVLQLSYNNGTAPQYNGNISNQTWLTAGQTVSTYTYRYDQLNRLIQGNATTGNSENSIRYDTTGNIVGLRRYSANTIIDQLKFNYAAGTSKLLTVFDSTSNDSGQKHGTTTYNFNGNGNLVSDDSKGITSISYNLLNLPQEIAQGSVSLATYNYDASGHKLSRLMGTTKTDYISGIQYDGSTASSTISFIQTDAGRALPNGSTAYNYEYTIQDQIGNNRVIFDTATGSTRMVQADNYYPFGLDVIPTGSPRLSPQSNYLFNNKEFQGGLGLYDYGARFYDPAIARWTSIDPSANGFKNQTPYGYAGDPISSIDPDGRNDYYFSPSGSVTYVVQSPGDDKFYQATADGFYGEVKAGDLTEQMGVQYAVTAQMLQGGIVHFTNGVYSLGENNGQHGTSEENEMVSKVTSQMVRQNYEGNLRVGEYNKYTGQIKGSGAVETPIIDPIDIFAGGLTGGFKALAASGIKAVEIDATLTVENIIANPALLEGKTLTEVQTALEKSGDQWVVGKMTRSRVAEGWVLREKLPNGEFSGRQIQWHPGSDYHPEFEGAYWKVSGQPQSPPIRVGSTGQ